MSNNGTGLVTPGGNDCGDLNTVKGSFMWEPKIGHICQSAATSKGWGNLRNLGNLLSGLKMQLTVIVSYSLEDRRMSIYKITKMYIEKQQRIQRHTFLAA